MSLVIESGSRTIMKMTTPPTGWTKDTSFNDYALRVTTGSVVNRTAGESFSIVFKNYTNIGVPGPVTYSVSATTISAAQMATHGHRGRTAPAPQLPTLFAARKRQPGSGNFGTTTQASPSPVSPAVSINSPTSGGGSHTHAIGTLSISGSIQQGGTPVSINLGIKYVDTIIAIRS